MSVPPAVFGERGERPVFFAVEHLPIERVRSILEIPGTTHTERGGVVGVACPWDVIESVAALTQLAAPPRPEDEGLYPGYERYAQLGLPEKTRPHQKEDIRFLCRRAYAILAEPMRGGKSLIGVASTVALGAERTLIVGPSISLWNWAKEVYQWTGEEALILSGLSATEARRFCGTCFGRGYLRPSHAACPSCRAKNGTSYGFRLHTVKTMQPSGGGYQCPRHPGFEVDWPNVLCPMCRRSLAAEMEQSRYIILNYELLTPLEQYDATGGAIGPRGGFGGWLEPLRAWRADVAIFDEAHMLRGWSTAKKQNPVRRERCRELVVGVPRVWALTGTPFWAHTRDIWGILDVISNGLYGGGRGIPGRAFMTRYCLPSEAPVLMADLRHKAIKDVRVGDLVWGWKQTKGTRRRFVQARVERVFVRKAHVVEVTMASGRKLRCTEDHQWANAAAKGQGFQEYVRALPKGVARQDEKGRIVPHATNRSRGTRLGFVTPIFPSPEVTDEYRRGYLHGLSDGDGTASYKWYLRPDVQDGSTYTERRRRVSIRLKDDEPIHRGEAFAKRLKIPVKTKKQKVLTEISFSGPDALRFFLAPRRGDDEYWRGYLGGVYDAEGWGLVFAQYQTINPEIYDNICDALERFKFPIRKDEEGVCVIGGRPEFMRLWALIQPAIKRKIYGMVRSVGRSEHKVFSNWNADEVVDVVPVGEQTVHCLQTTTGNFVAYGYGSKNCAGGPGEFGWTADGLTAFAETELMRRLQHVMIRHSRAEIYESLPPKTREVVDIEVEGVRRAGSLSRERLGAALADEIKHISAAKRAYVVEKVLSEVAEGAKVVVFCYHVESAEETLKELQKGLKDARFRRMNAKTWFVTGDRPATHKARDSMCEAFREAEGPGVFVATIKAMQVALSLKGAQSVHFIDLDYVPGAMFQAEDRCFDPDGKGFVVYYYQVRGSVDEDIVAAVRERIEMLDAMTNDAEANALRAAFDSVKMREETLDAIWARHTAHLRESLDEPSNLSEDGEP